MKIGRRDFIGTGSAVVAGMVATRDASAQEVPKPPAIPTRAAKIERLFKAPDVHPNALEAAPDGLWIGDQVSERIFKSTGRPARSCMNATESHNTSGVAVGGGIVARRQRRRQRTAAGPSKTNRSGK